MTADRKRPRHSPSLELRLPLLMSGLLAVILVAALALTYVTLTRSATATAAERLQRAAGQVAVLAESGIRQARGRYRSVAADSAIHRALREPTADTLVRAALGRLATPADSGMPVELWTVDGRRVAFIGTDLRADVRAGGDESESVDARAIPVPREGLDAAHKTDSLQLGALYASGGNVYYWLVVPVRERGRAVGYIVQQKRIASGEQVDRTIRALSGDSVMAYYRNRDGAFWSTLSGIPASPPQSDSTGRGVVRTRPGIGAIYSAEERIAGTPLVIVFELARRRVLARPRSAILTLAALSAALLAVGAAASWVISRRITRPIVSLTGAAEAIARGEYGARARASGDDEVARLAASFNRMAHEISAAHAALAQSNAELVTAREAAEAASRAKSDFLARMSHELRTPLNAIGGYTELIEMELRGPVTDAQRRDLDRIRVSQQHLLGLVSALLDLNRIERGQVTYQIAPIALDPVLAGLDALVGPQAIANGLRLEYVAVAPGLAVLADREKLRQILLNLLSNAIRYTRSGGSVVIAGRARDETTVEISVRDTGVGIPADKQTQIFEPFVQLDRSLTGVPEGVGLGLAISRDLARGMDGDLTVESRVEQGSCFTLTLPRGVVDAAEEVVITGESAAATAQS